MARAAGTRKKSAKEGDVVRKKKMFERITLLAAGLNKFKKGGLIAREDPRAWAIAESIAVATANAEKHGRPNKDLATALQLFNALAAATPARFTVGLITHPDDPIRFYPVIESYDHSREESFDVVARLYNDFFQNEGYLRLKSCRRCTNWFVDRGRNRRAVFCSTKCGNRWWNRDERSQAAKRDMGHTRRQS